MERDRSKKHTYSFLMLTLIVGFLSQNLVMSTSSFDDKKNYYTPDPGTPPTGSHGSPPSHGSPSSGGNGYGNPPSHGSPPNHGGGGGSPPVNCGIPPPQHHHHNPPSPHHQTPSPPTGGGGYHDPPSTPTPTVPTPTPTPTTPGISVPTSPFDPHSPPFSGTCYFWGSHPGLIVGIFGWWGTLGHTFGLSSLPGSGSTMTLPQALTNPSSDPFASLYREGTASLLNSMVNNRFPFTTQQVKNRFTSAVGSNKAAAAQAHVFKLANEGRIKPRA